MDDNAYMCAYPIGTDITQGQFAPEPGLTKRELFAAMAMQGLMANASPKFGGSASDSVAHTAVRYADELLKALEKTK